MNIKLKHIVLLLSTKVLMLLNGFLKAPTKKRMRKILSLVGGGILFFFIYTWIFRIFSTMGKIPSVGIEMMDNFITLAFLGFFIFLLVSGITISIHYLFISSDLPLLMVSPLSNNTIFTFKLIEAVFANSAFFFFMGMPIFITYGLINQAQWYYYPFMIINVLAFLTIPISISFLGALLIVRIIPPARAREFMAILLGAVSLGIWLVLQIVRASTFDKTSHDYSPQALDTLQQISQNSILNQFPSTWAARALSGFAHADVNMILLNFLPLMLLMIFIFGICVQLSKNAFKQGFISSEQSVTMRRKSRVKKPYARSFLDFSQFFSGIPASIFLRDFRLLFRDTRQFVNILMLAAMMVILPMLQNPDQTEAEFSNYFPYLFIIVFSAMISARISSHLIPIEGRSFWITKLLPQSNVKLILGKFLLGFLISALASWIAVGIISVYFDHPLRVLILALIATFCFSGALSSLGLLLATYFARFDWDHPKRMLSSAGGFLLTLLSLLTVGTIGGITVLIYILGNQFNLSQKLVDLFSVAFVFLLCLTVTLVTLILSAKKVDHMEWEF